VLWPGSSINTDLEVEITPEATVAQVNALLTAVGGRLVGTLARVSRVVVRFADPGDLAVLAGVEAQLATLPHLVSLFR
jgi:hypothetical protein